MLMLLEILLLFYFTKRILRFGDKVWLSHKFNELIFGSYCRVPGQIQAKILRIFKATLPLCRSNRFLKNLNKPVSTITV